MASLFTKIANGEIPGEVIHQDDLCFAIRDIHPVAPDHFLVIPRREIKSVDQATADDKMILGHVLFTAGELAKKFGLDQRGFRLVFNAGDDAGQTVPHLHVHVLAGRKLQWPPG